MSTASSRHLEKPADLKSSSSRGSSESVRAPMASTQANTGANGAKSSAQANGGHFSVAIVSPNTKTRLSSSTARGGLAGDVAASFSSSGSSPSSPLGLPLVDSPSTESLTLNLPVFTRSSTTQTKRLLAVDDDPRDSSQSKDADESPETDPLSPLIDDLKLGRSRSSSRRVSSARGLPSIHESDTDTISSASHRRKSKRNSQRSAPHPGRSISVEMGYASESTARDDASSTSPLHSAWLPSSSGPLSSHSRDRSASRSESPVESLRIRSRARTRSERRQTELTVPETRPIDSPLDDTSESTHDAPLTDRKHSPNPSASLPHPLEHAATNLGIARPDGRSTTRKKSKRPSKHEMLALNGVWAYERDGKMQIFGGTTSKMIGKLLDLLVTSPDRDHIYFLVHIFLHGARQFYNAAELLSVLLKYWDMQGEYPDPCGGNIDVVRSSIIFFLAAWFEKRFVVDFGNSLDSAKPALEKFMRKLSEQYVGPLQAKLKRYTTQELPIPTVVFVKPLSMSVPNHLSLLDIKPQVIAGQWTLLDMRNFQNIQLSEFYASDLEDRPEWSRILSRGESLTKWLAMSIVQQTQLSARTKALKRTIDLAIRFLELNNFHGLMCAWGAINTNAVHRLSKTFRKLPRASTDTMKSLEEKLSEANNFANLRWSVHKQRSQGAALIPWFELTAKNRNILDEFDDTLVPPGTKVTRENRDVVLFAFSKFAKFSDQIEEFLSCQHNNRLLDLHSTQTHTSEQIIQNWLSDLKVSHEEELWKLSIQCEPLDSGTGESSTGVIDK